MDYTVVQISDKTLSSALDKLAREVREMQSKGWKPQGGVSISVTSNYWYNACQAMTRG